MEEVFIRTSTDRWYRVLAPNHATAVRFLAQKKAEEFGDLEAADLIPIYRARLFSYGTKLTGDGVIATFNTYTGEVTRHVV